MNTPNAVTPVHTVNSEHTIKPVNIGIFGGTFDPIHLGHIKPILKAAELLALDKIHVMPANIPPHKNNTFSATHHRINMVKLACQENAKLHFDDCELKRAETSYTVNTLTDIRQALGDNAQIYFFIGMDSLINFTSWYRWQEILSLCHLAVSPRPGYDMTEIPSELKSRLVKISSKQSTGVKSVANNIYLLPEELHNISSTDIRTKIQASTEVKNLLPLPVFDYIEQHQLYR